MGPKELRREFPGSISAFYSHQVAFGVGIGLAIVALVIGGTVAWAALTGQLAPPKPVALGVTQSEYPSGGRSGNQVTTLAVDDPAHGYPATANVPPGAHLIGVEVRITNTGSSDTDPPYQPLSVVDSRGALHDEVDISATVGAAESPVKSGQTVTTTVFFDVPVRARVVEVDYEYYPPGLSATGGKATVAWAVPTPSQG
jgi:hypothetical protein